VVLGPVPPQALQHSLLPLPHAGSTLLAVIALTDYQSPPTPSHI
jgi:hypothetical protein